MTNEFAAIDAQDETSRLAQIQPEETMQPEENETAEAPTPEGVALNLASWNLLDIIHAAIAPQLDLLRERDAIMDAI